MTDSSIYVRPIVTKEDSELILKYMQESAVFFDKTDRFTGSAINCLIYKEDIPIGFLNLVDEHLRDFLFLDILIDEKYHGNGYAAMAYQNFKRRYNGNEFIIAETKVNNIPANKSLKKDGVCIYSFNDLNYYLMDKDRLEEFMNGESYQILEKQMHEPKLRAYQYILNIRDNN